MRKTSLLEVLNNLNKLTYTDDFINDVICSFEDYDFKGTTEVNVIKSDINNVDYIASINHYDADFIKISIKSDNSIEAWI